jgi:gamma-glutamyltranspeptidase/glutathione hydrolase/leukotriene-C4 hydrolase
VFAPQGKILQQGELCKREKLANTLLQIAQKGPNAFYEGEIAKNLISDIRAHDGIMTEEDLKMYTVKRRPTITSFYHGHKVVGAAPPASSVVVALILNILETFDLRDLKNTNGLTYHYFIEAMKHAFAHRAVMVRVEL